MYKTVFQIRKLPKIFALTTFSLVSIDILSKAYYQRSEALKKDPFRILIYGITGSGKSTLTNCILDKNVSPVSMNPAGTTKEIQIFKGTLYGRDIEIIDMPGFGDQTVKVPKLLEQWDKDIKGKEIDALLFTHVVNNHSLTTYEGSYAEIVRKCFEDKQYQRRVVLGVTFWNMYKNTKQAEP